MKIIHFFQELIFPSGCGICGNMLVTSEEAYWGLCTECRQQLDFSLEERCTVCGKPLISEIDICMHCRKSESETDEEKFVDSMMALYPYSGIYRNLLAAYKFKQYKQLSHFLAEKLLEAGSEIKAKIYDELTWIPVPPRPGKMKQRGWDQIDYLAGKLKKNKNISVHKCLKRLNTTAQKTLNRNQRLINLKGQIVCLGKAPKNVILFDDVVTTGATLEACAEALKKAGAKHVYAVCLFYD
jgi:ComF family protein